MHFKSDVQISQEAKLKPIVEIAEKLGLQQDDLELYGPSKAKVGLHVLDKKKDQPDGKLILVSAITPTPAGEGKTTTSIGLGQAMAKLGLRSCIALREPSLGPCMGMKGGATGGGYSQVVPMEDINLHFTGDIHAVGAAHNLLSALVDNHLYHWNHLKIDPRRVTWRRVIDINDRSLRNVVIGLGGAFQGVPRETGYDITVASELMAILCLAHNYGELKERINKIIIGLTLDKKPVTVEELGVGGAIAALLKDALKPNLVQTIEGVPAFIHGGPFANIAHGTNSILATSMALKCADYVVTEAGFGFDLGGEKFLNIKCRVGKLSPSAVVLIATVRALKLHGGVGMHKLKVPNPDAVEKGLPNLAKHIENVGQFALPVVVAINKFDSDTPAEMKKIEDYCNSIKVPVAVSDIWENGGQGGIDLAKEVTKAADKFKGPYRPLYELKSSIMKKVRTIARQIYGAQEVVYTDKAHKMIKEIEHMGYDHLPICMAKTQKSLSDDPNLLCRPTNFPITVQAAKVAAGAGFIIIFTGDIMTMPGLPRTPAANAVDIDKGGKISGLF